MARRREGQSEFGAEQEKRRETWRAWKEVLGGEGGRGAKEQLRPQDGHEGKGGKVSRRRRREPAAQRPRKQRALQWDAPAAPAAPAPWAQSLLGRCCPLPSTARACQFATACAGRATVAVARSWDFSGPSPWQPRPPNWSRRRRRLRSTESSLPRQPMSRGHRLPSALSCPLLCLVLSAAGSLFRTASDCRPLCARLAAQRSHHHLFPPYPLIRLFSLSFSLSLFRFRPCHGRSVTVTFSVVQKAT